MPLVIAVLVLLVLTGGLSSSDTSRPAPDDDNIIISTPSGGLVRGEADSSSNRAVTQVSNTEPAEELPAVPPQVDTLSAQNIETSRATLRGEVFFPGAVLSGGATFYYSRNAASVSNVSEEALSIRVTSRVRKSSVLTRNLSSLSDDTTYYYRLCFEGEDRICGAVKSFTTNEDIDRSDTYRFPSATTKAASSIQAESAVLEGSYRRNDASNTTVFFVYGEDEDLVREIEDEYDLYNDIEERDEFLQKKRVGVNVPSRGDYARTIDDLERNTEYFYSLCIAFDDDDETGIRCGSVRSFETKSRDRIEPSFSTVRANVDGTTVVFSATLSMQDYIDGYAFMVYGTDESEVTDVENDRTFSGVRQQGDELQKVSLDSDFDGRDDFTHTATDLITSTDYYYRFCTQYEAENDRGNDEDLIVCSNVQELTTD